MSILCRNILILILYILLDSCASLPDVIESKNQISTPPVVVEVSGHDTFKLAFIAIIAIVVVVFMYKILKKANLIEMSISSNPIFRGDLMQRINLLYQTDLEEAVRILSNHKEAVIVKSADKITVTTPTVVDISGNLMSAVTVDIKDQKELKK